MKFRTYFLFGAGLLFGLAILASLSFSRPHQFGGSLIDPPAASPEIALAGTDGHTFHLIDYAGQVVLLFFGYTNCPDVCPATLADFQAIKSQLGDKANQVTFVLVTVDPENDTTERMREYLANFDSGFIGLTGSRAELEPVWSAYGVYQAKVDAESTPEELEHSSRIYAIDPQGRLRLTYLFGTDRQTIVDDVLYLLKDQG
jgi:protein SCO1/2